MDFLTLLREAALFLEELEKDINFQRKTAFVEKKESLRAVIRPGIKTKEKIPNSKRKCQAIVQMVDPADRPLLQALLGENALDDFFRLASQALFKEAPKKEPRLVKTYYDFAQWCKNQILGKHKSQEIRATRLKDDQQKMDIASILKIMLANGLTVEDEIKQRAGHEAREMLSPLWKISKETPGIFLLGIQDSLQKSLARHQEILAMTQKRKPTQERDEQLEAGAAEIRAVETNLFVLSQLMTRITNWTSLKQEVGLAEKELRLEQTRADYNYDSVRAFQAFQSIADQAEDLLRRRQNALEQLANWELEISAIKRDALSRQIGQSGLPLLDELATQQMAQVLRDKGWTTFLSILGIQNPVDALGATFLGANWFPGLVGKRYFTSQPEETHLWQRIRNSLKILADLDLNKLLIQAVEKICRPNKEEFLDAVTERLIASRHSFLKASLTSVGSVNHDIHTGPKVLACYLNWQKTFADAPFFVESILQSMALALRQGRPLHLIFLSCLRHKYVNGIHTISTDLREPEWIGGFIELLRVLSWHNIPCQATVAVSDHELIFSAVCPPSDQRLRASQIYTKNLSQRFETNARILLLSDFFKEKGLWKQLTLLYEDFYHKIKASYQVHTSEAWLGWHHTSLQTKIEEEFAAHARVEIMFSRRYSYEWTYRHIAQGMATGAIFATIAQKEPLVLVVTGRQAAAQSEVKGFQAVSLPRVGIIFIPQPQN